MIGGLHEVIHQSQEREEPHSMGEGPERILKEVAPLCLLNSRPEWILNAR